jgi:nucleotide-binding universal stress UspA family protein
MEAVMKALETATHVTVRNVLFATDFSSYSNAALPYALAVAHQYGVKLYAAHVLSTEAYLFATPETWPALVELHEEREQIDFARLETHLRGVPHEVLSLAGDISDVLFRLIHDHNIDLLVLGTHGRTGLPKLLMGSVAEKIFRYCCCPVLTVGPHVPRGEKRVAEFNRILLATDFSDESLAAVPYAISLAQEHQAHLSLLHVLNQPEAGTVHLASDAAFLVRQMEKLVPPGSDFLFQPEYVVEFGEAPEQILGFARRHGVDLILLGVRAPVWGPGAGTHFSHTVAQHIVAQASCPVLTVRG